MKSKEKLPHIITVISFMVLIGFGLACATPLPYRPLSELPNAEVIGFVQATFEVPPNPPVQILNEAAYIALLQKAKKEYQGNIDIRDITTAGVNLKGGGQSWTASGKVVVLSGNDSSLEKSVEGALARAAEQTLKNVPAKSRIAIVYITAQDRSTTEYVVGELEYIWVNSGYFLTDRSQLDRLRKEQNFGMSGEVDDKTAAAIGKIAGASIIVTGRVDGEGNLRRLRLRALDTQTAQVVGVASERL